MGLSSFTLSQIFVCGALLFNIIGFQCKERKNLLISFIIAVTLLGIHFFFLGNITAGVLSLLSVLRYIGAALSPTSLILWGFVVANLALGVLTYEHTVDVLAIVGSVISVFATFTPEDKKLRQYFMVSSFSWFLHNLIIQSPAAVVLELFFFFSNVIGYYRFYLRGKSQ